MERLTPETPSDLQHPGRVSDGASPDSVQGAAQPDADNWPVFDDPIIGWWENAWSLRDADLDGTEPLV